MKLRISHFMFVRLKFSKISDIRFYLMKLKHLMAFVFSTLLHGKTFYINFYYCIFQFRERHITLRIFVSKNTKLYNNDMKLQHS